LFRASSTAPLVVSAVSPSVPILSPAWRRLQQDGAVDTPFLTWEWFSAFAECPSLSRDCIVLLVNRPGSDTIGLLPLEITPGRGNTRTIRCAGTETLGADHLDVVAAPGDRDAVAAAVARHVARRLHWDLADFEGLARDGALARALGEELRSPRFIRRRSTSEPVPIVTLRGPDAEAVRNRLCRRSARGTKWAARAGGGYSVVEDPADVGSLMESLMTMHNARFGERSEVFSTPDLRRFHVRAATRLAAAGLARIGRLFTSEGDIALEYVLLHDDRAFSYQSGFLPDGGHSPGRTVMCRSILTAADEGRAEYDLLRGDEEYKLEYATGSRPDVRVRALRPTRRAAVWVGGNLLDRLIRVGRRGWLANALV